MRTMTALLFMLMFSSPATAAPSIGELLDKVAASNARVTRAAADVVRARAAYEAQQAKILAAAAALLGGEAEVEAPRSRLARLLDVRAPQPAAQRKLALRPARADRLAALRKTNPSGREIYDSLTFHR